MTKLNHEKQNFIELARRRNEEYKLREAETTLSPRTNSVVSKRSKEVTAARDTRRTMICPNCRIAVRLEYLQLHLNNWCPKRKRPTIEMPNEEGVSGNPAPSSMTTCEKCGRSVSEKGIYSHLQEMHRDRNGVDQWIINIIYSREHERMAQKIKALIVRPKRIVGLFQTTKTGSGQSQFGTLARFVHDANTEKLGAELIDELRDIVQLRLDDGGLPNHKGVSFEIRLCR